MNENMENPDQETRLRIWQVRCEALDHVLVGTFEWRELADLVPYGASGSRMEGCRFLPPQDRMFHLAHALCHEEESDFACLLERRLDRIYASEIEQVRRMTSTEVAYWCFRGEPGSVRPGLMWALSTDARDDVAWAFGTFLVRMRLASMKRFQELVG